MSLPFGISVQSLGILGSENQVIVDLDHRRKLRYWGGHEKGWVDSVFKAKVWTPPAPGEAPYAENNAYSLWMRYEIGPYRVATTHGITLSTCGIAYHDLYLAKLTRMSPRCPFELAAKNVVTEWTSNIYESLRINGLEQLRELFFEVVSQELK